MSNFKKKRILHGQVKKLFYQQTVLSFRRDFALDSDWTIVWAFIIYFVCGVFQLSSPVGYRYLYTVKY